MGRVVRIILPALAREVLSKNPVTVYPQFYTVSSHETPDAYHLPSQGKGSCQVGTHCDEYGQQAEEESVSKYWNQCVCTAGDRHPRTMTHMSMSRS